MASVLLVCLASYLLGSIPNGLVFGKLIWHVDLREYQPQHRGDECLAHARQGAGLPDLPARLPQGRP